MTRLTSVGPRRPALASMLLALGVAAIAQQAKGQAEPTLAGGGAAASGSAADPAPAGTPLQAIVIDVSGKVQWRPSSDAPWKNAAVNDVIEPGAEVRTGLRSHAALRMRNATALIDAGTVFQIPAHVQDGDVLRTTVAVKHGRADFKVDKVGLSNDFKVVTPSTTLAVRGTEFAIATGALKQVEVVGARRNAIGAIELKYALSNTTVQMSGAATSTSSVQQPTHAAMVSTAAPTTAGALPSTNATETVQQAAVGPSPANAGSPAQTQKANTSTTKSQVSVAKVQDASNSDGGSVVATINRALIRRGGEWLAEAREDVRAAHERVEHSIHRLLTDLDGDDLVEANQDALAALRAFAEVRRDAARDALAQHQSARVEAAGAEAQAAVDRGAFEVGNTQLLAQLGVFDQEAVRAAEALEVIQQFIDAERDEDGAGSTVLVQASPEDEGSASVPPGQSTDSGDGPRDEVGTGLIAQATSAHDALQAMGDALDDARGSLIGMSDRVLAVDALVSAVEEGARIEAQDAIDRYEGALGDLQLAVAEGGSAADVWQASENTVGALRELIDELARLRPAPELLASANAAADELAEASAALQRAQVTLQAVQQAQAVAETDPRAQLLGQVEAIYARMLAVRLELVGRWFEADQSVTDRDDALAAALEDGQATFESLAELGAERAGEDTGRAIDQLVRADVAVDASIAALNDEFDALADGVNALDAAERAAADAALALAAAEGESQSFADAEAAGLSVIAGLAESEDRASDVTTVADALESMRGALDSLAALESEAYGAAGQAPGEELLEELNTRALSAIDRMVEAALEAADAAGQADDAAGSSEDIRWAVGALLELAQSLEDRFGEAYGTSAAGVAEADASVASSAELARAAADAAAQLRTIAESVAIDSIDADRMGELLAEVRGTIAEAFASAEGVSSLRESAESGFLARADEAGAAFVTVADDAAGSALVALDAVATQESVAVEAAQAHAEALDQALDGELEVLAVEASFDDAQVALGADLESFDAAVVEVQGFIDALAASTDSEEIVELVEALRASIADAGDAFDAASGSLGAMQVDRGIIDGVVAGLDAQQRAAADESIAAYEAAFAALDEAIEQGLGHEAVAAAAEEAMARVESLVAGLGELLGSDAQLAAAELAADRLALAGEALSAASSAMADAESLRAGLDGADADFGAVADLVAALEAIQSRVQSDEAEAVVAVDDRATELGTLVQGAEDAIGGAAGTVAAEVVALAVQADEAAGQADAMVALVFGADAIGGDFDSEQGGGAVTALIGSIEDGSAGGAAAREAIAYAAAEGRLSEAIAAADAVDAAAAGFDDAVGRFDAAAGAALEGLSVLGTNDRRSERGFRGRSVADVVAALDAMDAALLGALGVAHFEGAVVDAAADQGALEGLDGLVAQATQAIDEILAASSAAEAAASDAIDAADGADFGAAAVESLLAVSQELNERFGLSTAAVEAASALATAASAGALDSADRAVAAQTLLAELASVVEGNRTAQVADEIVALLDGNAAVAEGVSADAASVRADYVAVNEYGTATFADLTDRMRLQVETLEQGASFLVNELDEMVTASGAFVAALDGAQASAGIAEVARDRAQERRQQAEQHETAAHLGLQSTQQALGGQDLAGASGFAIGAFESAGSARVAADAATGFWLEAKGAAEAAEGYAAASAAIGPDVFKYGNNEQAFNSAAAARSAGVAGADLAAQEYRQQAEFFDDVAQALSGRAGTAAAAELADGSGDARALAIQAAQQLSGYAAQAQLMATQASTNAGRLFGRSMVSYVNRAQAAAGVAENQAQLANAAASRAEASGAQAIQLVNDARN